MLGRETIVTMRKSPETLGLYLSVPFCRAKCSFCNFASGVSSVEVIERYVGLLCGEIRDARRAAAAMGVAVPETVDTIYFGGGTPSLLESAQLERIFQALRSEFQLASEQEITLEAAPGQIGDALLTAALRLGVNRVSLGVQSFVDREAQAVGRSHTEASCLAEIRRLQAAGVTNLGADLIAGLPHQTEASWERSLETAAGCGLSHLSVYMLEVDDDSRLGREVLGGGARLHAPAVPTDDLIAALYERACEHLPSVGFGQYEISNFAMPGYRSAHNLKYWNREPYLGFGLDAHSMLVADRSQAVRWANPVDLEDYVGAGQERATDWVSEREAFEETVFLGLRLADGLAPESVAPFRREWIREFTATAESLAKEGLMRKKDGWSLTAHGRAVSSEVFGELLATVSA